MRPDRFHELRKQFPRQRVVVLGDIMLDTYVWGSVSRISPEAPVPVVAIDRIDHRPGGAANVAYNLRSLGAEVMLVGVSGVDAAGEQIERTLSHYDIDHEIIPDASRPTTEKTRVIAESQHVVRLDMESTAPPSDHLVQELAAAVERALEDATALVLQDYHKGTLTRGIIELVCGQAEKIGCPVFVDPKVDHLDSYHGVSLIKPNQAEAEHFCGKSLQTDEDIKIAGQALREQLNVEVVLITRGSQGMDLFDHEGYHRIPTRARKVADVCGAGDTVISTYAMSLLAGATPREAAVLANYAAATVVEEVGVVPVSLEKLEGLLLHYDSP